MFTLQPKENPLATLLGGLGIGAAEGQLNKMGEQQRVAETQNIFKQLSQAKTPLDRARIISQAKPEQQQMLWKGLEYEEKLNERMQKGELASQKIKAETQKKIEKGILDEETLKGIEELYGPTAAKAWKYSTEGGRTELQKLFVDVIGRKESVENLLSQKGINTESSPESIEAAAKTALTGKFAFPKVNPFTGYRSHEIPKRKTELRKENVPVFEKAKDRVRAAEQEVRSVGILKSISPNLPEGWAKVVINPSTGNPYGVAKLLGLVNADTQRWEKTINDFTTHAKDSYGARVTNFDLQQFMARLPGLMNTPEGRQVILDQMEIVAKLDSAYEDALLKVYRHYGADNITREDADEIAESMIEDKKAELTRQLEQLGQESDRLFDESQQASSQEYDELPDPATYKGPKRIKDTVTGITYELDRNTNTWRKVNG